MPKQNPLPCQHCEGQGYTAVRDCVGTIQYESTCQMCGGTGEQPEASQPTDEMIK